MFPDVRTLNFLDVFIRRKRRLWGRLGNAELMSHSGILAFISSRQQPFSNIPCNAAQGSLHHPVKRLLE